MGTFIGIDPGLSGAIAVITDNSLIRIYDTPTTTITKGAGKSKKNKRAYVESRMVEILSQYNYESVHIGIEKVHSMPGQGVASMFSMGYGYGLWIGIVVALKLPYTLITPQRWKKELMSGMSKEKAASCIRAQQLYPDGEFFTPRGRAWDGRGDSVLIATYLKQTT